MRTYCRFAVVKRAVRVVQQESGLQQARFGPGWRDQIKRLPQLHRLRVTVGVRRNPVASVLSAGVVQQIRISSSNTVIRRGFRMLHHGHTTGHHWNGGQSYRCVEFTDPVHFKHRRFSRHLKTALTIVVKVLRLSYHYGTP